MDLSSPPLPGFLVRVGHKPGDTQDGSPGMFVPAVPSTNQSPHPGGLDKCSQ